MTNPHNNFDENDNTDELEKMKATLGKALKAQTALTKELTLLKLTQAKEQKKFLDEKQALQNIIEQLNFKIGILTAHTEKLGLDLAERDEQIKNLTTALDKQVSSSNNVETKEDVAPAAPENLVAKPSAFGIWRLIGRNNQKNQDHEPLADLTNESVKQAILENKKGL